MSARSFTVDAIAIVRNTRPELSDDGWGEVDSVIELAPDIPTASLDGLAEFSHVEIVYLFHLVGPGSVVTGRRHPRGNIAWPEVGIFAQRAKDRPNRIGTTIARLMRVDGNELHVRGLDAVDGTPVIDIKPVLSEFLPREPVRQPLWSRELMREYWEGKPNTHD